MKNKQLKYLKLFEGLTPEEIPYSKVSDDGLSIYVPKKNKKLKEIYNQLTDEVTGSIFIHKTESITDVAGFNKLTEIGRYLSIKYNKSLTSLTGFNKLTRVGGYLSIDNNESLTSVTGFNNLKRVGGYLSIDNNKSLTSVTGFNKLTRVGGYIAFYENESLTEVTGFNKLTEIDTNLYIQNNPKLVAMSIPGSILRSFNYSKYYGIYYDNDLKFKSPPEFINSPVIINDLVSKFNPGDYSTQVIKQIIENVEKWGTEDTKDKVYNYLAPMLTPEQLDLTPTHIQHLYHPDYKNTSVRDIAKFNSGQIYGIF